MERYIALLRGINVGGHKKVPMKELKALLEENGYTKVKTLLVSGNIIFTSTKDRTKSLQPLIEKHFGFSIETMILPSEKFTELVNSDPFYGIEVTKSIRLYVTFMKEEVESDLSIPYETEDQSFKILKRENKILYSVLDVDKTGTIDGMKILEKSFGKNLTTRNYNTVVKIAKSI